MYEYREAIYITQQTYYLLHLISIKKSALRMEFTGLKAKISCIDSTHDEPS